MTQPDKPDRAADAAMSSTERRVAEQLHQAVSAYEPDGERIRRLIDIKSETLGGTPLREPRRQRGLSGRTVLWPAVGSAAAAAVILAVAAAGAENGGTSQPASGVTVSTTSPADPADPAKDSASSTPPALPDPTSTQLNGATPTSSSPHASKGSAHLTATTTTMLAPATSPGAGGGSGAGGPTPAVSTPAGGGAAPSSTSTTIGGHQLTATVQAVAAGQAVALGTGPESYWLATNALANQPHPATGSSLLGQAQALGPGVVAQPGPFRVSWQNGTPAAAGSSSTWLSVPAKTPSGGTPGLRVAVRYRTDPTTVVLYVGTAGGSGQIRVQVPAGEVFLVNLPSCTGTCGFTVTVAMHAVQASLPTTGDLTVDLFAVGGTDSRVGLAAATLS